MRRGELHKEKFFLSFGEDRNVLSLCYVGSPMDVGSCQNRPSGELEVNAGGFDA